MHLDVMCVYCCHLQDSDLRIWITEPHDNTPVLCYGEENWVIADLAIYLADNNEFSFQGTKARHITIEHCGEVISRDTEVSSISNISVKNPLVAFVDPNLCKFQLLHVQLFNYKIFLDGIQLRSFDVRPSGFKDKRIIKHLIHQADSYSHFLMMITKVEKDMIL